MEKWVFNGIIIATIFNDPDKTYVNEMELSDFFVHLFIWFVYLKEEPMNSKWILWKIFCSEQRHLAMLKILNFLSFSHHFICTQHRKKTCLLFLHVRHSVWMLLFSRNIVMQCKYTQHIRKCAIERAQTKKVR